MWIDKLNIFNLRNIIENHFSFSSQFNIIIGRNGSGKTSILEAIYILSTGKSFRTSKSIEVINKNAGFFIVNAKIKDAPNQGLVRIGLEKFIDNTQKIRINETNVNSIAENARLLPLQLINTASLNLLEAGPEFRRQFLDWGVFHVEHSFHSLWNRFKRLLAQRNAALKQYKLGNKRQDIHIWDKDLIEVAENITELRTLYLKDLNPYVICKLNDFGFGTLFSMAFDRGWGDNQASFSKALEYSLPKDKALGFTTIGPHRAELDLVFNKIPVKSFLSRGQTKLFVSALLLARAKFLKQKMDQNTVFLIDDISSELDKYAIQTLIDNLKPLNMQVIMTSIEFDSLSAHVLPLDVNLIKIEKTNNDILMSPLFHVEHG
ncbi:MAG: replication/repair protein RecF [Francisellaceae bacterium]|nr:replication/repair protein RecF [Francisellaceae bacterium]